MKSKKRIVFVGYQTDDELIAVPFYNLPNGIGVDANSLVRDGIKIPKTPSFKEEARAIGDMNDKK